MSRRRHDENPRPAADDEASGLGPRAVESPEASRELQEDIARRAYELYLARGGEPGNDLEDWFRAEAELRGRSV